MCVCKYSHVSVRFEPLRDAQTRIQPNLNTTKSVSMHISHHSNLQQDCKHQVHRQHLFTWLYYGDDCGNDVLQNPTKMTLGKT